MVNGAVERVIVLFAIPVKLHTARMREMERQRVSVHQKMKQIGPVAIMDVFPLLPALLGHQPVMVAATLFVKRVTGATARSVLRAKSHIARP